MKIIFKGFVLSFILFISSSFYAQIGIGTTTPDTSSILDVYSTSQGLLMPRLTTAQRDLIVLPATGLMIYNTTTNDCELNIGTPADIRWLGITAPDEPIMYSITEGGYTSTTSSSNSLVPGITLSPSPGTYMAFFNGQMSNSSSTTNTESFSSSQGVIDMDNIYQTLKDYPGGETHLSVFGNNEVLTPGVYDVAGAVSIAGTLTLDGGSASENPVFIIRGGGAFTTGTNSTVLLVGNAKSENIFWLAETALSTGDPTILKGSMVSGSAAVSLGANTNIEGRMFTRAGAITMGANCILTSPTNASPIDLGLLSTFAMFSSNGAVSDSSTCETYGDVGTAVGALTFTGLHVGEKYTAGTTGDSSTVTTVSSTTYSIFQNGVEVENSSRTVGLKDSVVSLQAMITVTEDSNPLEIRWKVDDGESTLVNRTLSLIRSQY